MRLEHDLDLFHLIELKLVLEQEKAGLISVRESQEGIAEVDL